MTPRRACTAALAFLVGACSSTPDAPVSDRSASSRPDVPNTSYRAKRVVHHGFHVVEPGDTLFSIAWGAGVDYRALARWNGIEPPYIIRPGQRVSLVPVERSVSKNAAAPAPTPQKPAPVDAAKTPAKSPAKTRDAPLEKGPPGWIWPVKGPILKGYSASGSNKGIDIGGNRGHGVRAAAGGKVVYAGSGLRGYGQLIIVKHDEEFLSAYAHNSKLLVEDGQSVSAGQQIALMGDTGTDRVKLHFEIRRRGKPVDPLKFLPARY